MRSNGSKLEDSSCLTTSSTSLTTDEDDGEGTANRRIEQFRREILSAGNSAENTKYKGIELLKKLSSLIDEKLDEAKTADEATTEDEENAKKPDNESSSVSFTDDGDENNSSEDKEDVFESFKSVETNEGEITVDDLPPKLNLEGNFGSNLPNSTRIQLIYK